MAVHKKKPVHAIIVLNTYLSHISRMVCVCGGGCEWVTVHTRVCVYACECDCRLLKSIYMWETTDVQFPH